MPTGHATIIGGSNAKRRLLCPGSLHAEKAIPASSPSYAAAEGTACHQIMEEYFLNEIDTPGDYLGQTIEVDGHKVPITAQLLAEKIDPALDAWTEIQIAYPPANEIIVEPVVGYTEGAWGSTDLIWRDQDNVVNVLDWKFGRTYVDHNNSYQLKFYAGAALFGVTTNDAIMRMRDGLVVDTVRLIVVQPLHDPVWRTVELSIHDIERFAGLVKSKLPEMQDPKATRHAGPWCGFCRAKPTCDTYVARFKKEVETPPEWAALSGEDIAGRKTIRDLAEAYVKAYDELEKRALENGVAIPGRKLVQGRGRWAWLKERQEELVELVGEAVAYKERELRSMSALKAQLRDRKDLLDRLPDFAEKKSGGLTVVNMDDPRDAETPNLSRADGRLAAAIDNLAKW